MTEAKIKIVTNKLNDSSIYLSKSRKLEREALDLCECPEEHAYKMPNGNTMCTICKIVSYKD
jgi:hypothetical protein